MINIHKINVTVAGAAGSATGSTTSSEPIIGTIEAIALVYTTQPATCDVTIATVGNGSLAETILTVSNANTDGWFYPAHAETTNANAAIADSYSQFIIADKVTVSVAQGDAGAVTCYIKTV